MRVSFVIINICLVESWAGRVEAEKRRGREERLEMTENRGQIENLKTRTEMLRTDKTGQEKGRDTTGDTESDVSYCRYCAAVR